MLPRTTRLSCGDPCSTRVINAEAPQGRAVGALWLSEEGIPMKCGASLATDKGKVSTIRWELRHVKIGAQDAALFEIPRATQSCRRRRPPHCSVCAWRDRPHGRRERYSTTTWPYIHGWGVQM